MGFAINLTLLILGTTGALAAFGGETWKKGENPLPQRITRRGWIALTCMLLTLALGIIKETRNNEASAEAATRQLELEQNLTQTTAELQETRRKLTAVEPNLLHAMVLATTGLRRETDHSTPSVDGQPSQQLISGRTRSPLILYGGDHIDYHIFCSGRDRRVAGLPSTLQESERTARLMLKVGNTDYPLNDHGRQMIIGPVGQPMEAILLNPNRARNCQVKMLVESADRTREAAQLQPLIQMIQQARASSNSGEIVQP